MAGKKKRKIRHLNELKRAVFALGRSLGLKAKTLKGLEAQALRAAAEKK